MIEPRVAAVNRILDDELRADSRALAKQGAQPGHESVGPQDLPTMLGRDVGQAEDVRARSHRPRSVGPLEEPTDRKGAAGRGSEDGEELASLDTRQQPVVKRVVEEVMRGIALLRIVVHEHRLAAELSQEGGEPVRPRVRAREEDKHLAR